MSRPSFAEELKRRRVFRVAAVYAAAAFVVLQAADLIIPAVLLPEWTFRLVVVIAILGFPIAVAMAWAFDLTPEGLQRTEGSAIDGGRRRVAIVAAVSAVVTILGLGLAMWWRGGGAASAEAPAARLSEPDPSAVPVVAVLPFDDLSRETGNEYFSDGVAEDILTNLTSLGDLRVISRQSIVQYRDSEKTTREIADELGATHVVLGSARRVDDQVRVTAQLVDALRDRQVWASSYDRELTASAIFQIQSEVAQEIARALETRLSSTQRERLAIPPTEDLTAYDYYLRAREHARGGTLDGYRRAIAFYRQAIEIDPDYALAWAALSGAFTALEGAHGLGRVWLDSGLVAARRSLDLDPGGADGLNSLALYHWNAGQPAEATELYERVLAIRPNDPQALWGLAFIHWILVDLDEAVRLAERSAELGPAQPNTHALLGRSYWAIGEFARAEAAFRRVLALQPDSPWGHEDLVRMYISQNELDRAAEQLSVTGTLLPGSPEFLEGSAWLALRRGDPSAARRYAEEALGIRPDASTPRLLLGMAESRAGAAMAARRNFDMLREAYEAELEYDSLISQPAVSLAAIAASSGDRDEALDWLDRAYERGWRGWPWIDLSRAGWLEELRGRPRFEEMRARILADVERIRAGLDLEPRGRP